MRLPNPLASQRRPKSTYSVPRRVAAALLVAVVAGLPARAQWLERVSAHFKSPNGVSGRPAISGNGRFVAYSSTSGEVFLYDRVNKTTAMVAVNGAGEASTGDTPALNANGRIIAFKSLATNLIPTDKNGRMDVFLRDRVGLVTEWISVDNGAAPAANGTEYPTPPAVAPDAETFVFDSGASNLVAGDTAGFTDVFVRDAMNAATRRISVGLDGQEANGDSFAPALSSDVRFVAFASAASNLTPDDSNLATDIFLYSMADGRLTMVSVSTDGEAADASSAAPSISTDGRYVAFESNASNLVPNDSNDTADIFVRDLQTGETRRVSVDTFGSQANGRSSDAAISGDGRYVVFASTASNLTPGDTNGSSDVFVHDTSNGVTTRLSVGANGEQANWDSAKPALSTDGRFVAFGSLAYNLVTGDDNKCGDVFLRPLALPAPVNGDVDGNGAFDVNDIVAAARVAAGLQGANPNVIARGDASGDAAMTFTDPTLLLRRLRAQ